MECTSSLSNSSLRRFSGLVSDIVVISGFLYDLNNYNFY